MKPTEVPVLFLKEERPGEVDLCIGYGHQDLTKIRLRPGQLRNLVVDGTKMALHSNGHLA